MTDQERDDRPARYVELDEDGEERIIYRASSLGICDRAFMALGQGMEPMAWPEWFQEILDEGTEAESTIREMYKEEHGFTVEAAQDVLELEIIPGVWIRGHIDGEIQAGEKSHWIWEGKKVRESGWSRFLRSGVEFQRNYPWQVSFYMHAMQVKHPDLEIGCVMTGGRFDPDKGEVTEIHNHIISNPPIPLKAIKLRIMKLEKMIAEDASVMDVKCPSPADYPCPFFFLHDDGADEPAERPGDDIIAPLLKEWEEFKDAERRAKEIYNPDAKHTKERLKSIKEGVAAWLEASGVDGDEVVVDLGEGPWTVKAVEVERAGYEVKATTYTKVTIKPPKREEAINSSAKKAAKKAPAKKKAAAKKRAAGRK